MIIQSVWQKSFDFFGKPVVVEPSEAEHDERCRLAADPAVR